MNRRKFALSWGRKLFFGLSWPLSLVLGLVYLRSSILPESSSEWIFFATSYIGYFGLLNALAYFLIFAPIVAIMPSYYVSRFVSVILILALNLFITADAITFANYHHHIYGFLSELILEKGIENFIGSSAIVILSVALLVFGILIWIRGEMIWRWMQTRFSNPVKNWYLVLIVLLLLVGKGTFYYGNISSDLGTILPFDMNYRQEGPKVTDNKKFFYPKDEVTCLGKNSPNIIFITLREWSEGELNPDSMPLVSHMKRHAVSYSSNYGVATDPDGGRFSLFYSIPASYMDAAHSREPLFFSELQNRRYEILEFVASDPGASPTADDEKNMAQFRQWLLGNTGEEITPRYFSFSFRQHSSEVDKYIQEIVLLMQKEQFLPGSHIIITGAHQGSGSLIPLMHIQPDRKSEEISGITSQYDIIPTLMQKAWGCKNVFKNASVGESLDKPNRDWILLTSRNGDFRILDFKNNNQTSLIANKIQDAPLNSAKESRPQHDLIFDALKQLATFSKK